MAKKRKNLSQDRIKIHILTCLYGRGQIGANAYVIMHKANIPSQDHNRFKEFLEELCSKSFLEKYIEETSGDKGRIKYRITQNGRILVDKLKHPFIQSFLGSSIEDLLE